MMKWKNILITMSILLFSVAYAYGAIDTQLNPSTNSVQFDEAYSVNAVLLGPDTVASFNLVVNFDRTLVKVTTVVANKGVAPNQTAIDNANDTTGSLTIPYADLTGFAPGVGGTIVATINFQALTTLGSVDYGASSTNSVQNTSLADVTGDLTGGTVNITAGPDTTAPVFDTAPSLSSNTILAGTAGVTLNGTLSDAASLIAKYEWIQSATLPADTATGTTVTVSPAASPAPFTIDIGSGAFAAGTYSYWVRGYDNSTATAGGNKTAWTAATNNPLTVQANAVPAVSDVAVDPASIAECDATVTLTATATEGDDGQTVADAEYSTDGGTTWAKMTAADGVFDSATENLTATVDSTAFLAPSQTLWVRAQDSESAWTDPPASVTLTVTANAAPVITAGSVAVDKASVVVGVSQNVVLTAEATDAIPDNIQAAEYFIVPQGTAVPDVGTRGTAMTGTFASASETVTANFDPKTVVTGGLTVGTYTIWVRAQDSSCKNQWGEAVSTTIEVTECDVQAAFTSDKTSVVVGGTITYTDATVPTAPATVNSYAWAFTGGDIATVDTEGPHTVTYGTLGTYTADLTTTSSSEGNCSTSAAQLTVEVLPCDAQAAFTVSSHVTAAGTPISFTNTTVETGDAVGTATYSWAVTGTSAETVTTATLAEAPAFTFMGTAGVYEVTLTATGSTGCETTFGPVTIYVNDPACENTVGSSIVTEPAAVEPNPLKVAPNTDVNFSILAADGVELTDATFAWNFGDGSAAATTETAVHPYAAEGTYTVILAVTEAAPGTCVWYSEATIEVVCDVTAAAFTEAVTGLAVTFTNTSTGPAVEADPPTATYAWDFGDTTGTSADASPTYTYAAAGTYTVTLTVTGSGCSKVATKEITVADATCNLIPGFTAPTAAIVGQTVTFTGNATGITGAATYTWNFGNGATGAGQISTNTYTTAGTYNVVMTVTDNVCTKILSKTITITTGQPPVSVTAAFSANVTTGVAPLTVNFTDSSTASNCTLSGWSWNFGDGGTSTEKNPAHTYTNPGVYTVSLTASCSGASNTVTKTAYITVTGCTASFTAAGTGNALEVLFDASASGNAVAYEWDFGDGTGGQGVSGTHTYAAAGTYTVKLKVTGASENCVGVAQRTVIVSENCVASAHFTAAASEAQTSPFPFPLPGLNTLTVNFDAEGSTGDTFAWEFGDGNTGTGKQASNTYAAAGTYNVTLTVTAANGCSATATQRVNVGTGCVADASFTAFTEENSLSVSFAANSSGTGYAWEFGDGSTASGMSVTHAYAASGSYEVKLTVTSGNCTDIATQTVTVQSEECPAVAAFTWEDMGNLTVSFDTAGSVGTLLFDYGDGQIGTAKSYAYTQAGTYTVKLTATSTTDTGNECSTAATASVTVSTCAARAVFTASSDGLTVTFDTTGSVGTLGFDYGDGQTGTETTHTYSAPGTYTVVLTATADDGCSRTRSLNVNVCNVAAAFTAQPVQGEVPLTVNFDASESVGESFAWDFGDGTVGEGVTPSHEYAAAGIYTVVLTVSDGICTATDQVVISVDPVCTLVAAFTALPGDDVLTVKFDASASSGDSFAWNFGDGSTGNGKIASHAYAAEGTYVVTLTVRGCNTTATLEKTVVVVSPSPNRPDAPVLTAPTDGMVNVILQAILKSGAFHSPAGAGHGRSVWQIALDPDFAEMVFSLISSEHLTSLTLPEFILNPGTSYYWRVRYLDGNGLASDWSEVFTFVTLGTNEEDLNGNGVPDAQEVANPPWAINGLWVKLLTGEGYIGLEGLEGVEEIGWFKWLDVRTVEGLPGIRFPWGQFTWKLKANAKTAKVKIHFSSALPAEALWYNYNIQKGWRDLTDIVTFAADMKSVIITFTDGGADDADGVENGWIVDPAGFGVVETTTACCEDKSDGGSCFIETAGSGKVLAGLVLMLITGLSLLGFRKSQR